MSESPNIKAYEVSQVQWKFFWVLLAIIGILIFFMGKFNEAQKTAEMKEKKLWVEVTEYSTKFKELDLKYKEIEAVCGGLVHANKLITFHKEGSAEEGEGHDRTTEHLENHQNQ